MKKLLVGLLLVASSVLSFGDKEFLMKNYHFQVVIYLITMKNLLENLKEKIQEQGKLIW